MSLGSHFDEFIARQIESGRYGSASEVARVALRLLEDHGSNRNTLRRLLEEGEQSGRGSANLTPATIRIPASESLTSARKPPR